MGVKLNVKFEKTVGQFHIFDWDAPKLQEWSIKAQEMQNVHCNENNGTKSFDYDDTESDAIQLRVCQSLFGLRHTSPEAEKKGLPKGTIFSFLRAYSWIERKRARKFQKKIVQYGKNNDGKFVFNLVFVSSAFPDGKGGFNASENAVFVLGESQNVYLDAGCRKYDSWEDYQLENTLPNGVMLYPKDGNYTPKPDNVVILNARETPACTPSAKAKEFIDQVVMVGGLLLTGAVVVSMLPFTLFSAATMAAISTGSFYIGGALTTYSAAMGIYDKIQHDESIMTEMFMVATVACSALSQVVSRSWADQFGKNIANGESWSNVVKGLAFMG
uniref:DUF4781 domain-containing protein n=1 Tax=Panagrolaimus sp. JU765 TaxID=591449 RepID=A0AC34QT97_9BILA